MSPPVEGATPAARIDPVAVKRGQAAAWDAISSGWELALGVFERGGASMTERLLELGGVRPGQSVLDVGTGLGEPALPAARAVGPAGRVVGVDISPAMLEVARRRACAAGGGAAPVDFVVADLESIDLPARSFDVALSRWGLMFALDHVAALRTLKGLLVPGGVLAAAVWSTPPRAPMMSMGYSVLAERLELPPAPPGMPGPFGMADPERVAGELAEAGFAEVSVTEFVVPFRLDSPREYAAFTRDVSPPALLRTIRDRFGSEDDPGTWEAVAAAAARHAGGTGGLFLPSTALCLRAVAPRT